MKSNEKIGGNKTCTWYLFWSLFAFIEQVPNFHLTRQIHLRVVLSISTYKNCPLAITVQYKCSTPTFSVTPSLRNKTVYIVHAFKSLSTEINMNNMVATILLVFIVAAEWKSESQVIRQHLCVCVFVLPSTS